MYKRQTSYWSVIGLFLTIVYAVCFATCVSWPTVPLNGDKRCVVGRIELDCGTAYRLR